MLDLAEIALRLRDVLMGMNAASEARHGGPQTLPIGDGCYFVDEHNRGEFASQNTNRVEHLGTEGRASEALIDQLIERYEHRGVPRFFVYLSPSAQAAELSSWLTARGLQKGRYGLSVLQRVAFDAPEPQTDFELRLASPSDADLVRSALGQEPGDPEHPWAKGSVNPLGTPGFHTLLALDGARPIATGSLYIAGEVGYLHRGTTREADRKRGAQTALIAAALGSRATSAAPGSRPRRTHFCRRTITSCARASAKPTSATFTRGNAAPNLETERVWDGHAPRHSAVQPSASCEHART